jgi:ketosteroid isomerase-like protein
MMDEEAEVRALIEERIAAIRDGDAARAIATLAPGIIAFELAPPLALGPEAARDQAGLEAWLAGWQAPPAIEVRDLAIAVSGDVAWSHALDRLSGTLEGGREVDMWIRSTLCFRKIAGAWKIAHGHSSVPFRMDGSFRAATDLKP